MLESSNRHRATPLHDACWFGQGDVQTVRLLVEGGANVMTADDAGNTPLHLATKIGKWECVRFLLQAGADHRVRNHRQATPLHCAAKALHGVCVKLLLAAGADPLTEDGKGRLPIQCSRLGQCVKWMLSEAMLWASDMGAIELSDEYNVFPSRNNRKLARRRRRLVRVRRVRDTLRPLVDPRQKARRQTLYANSPLLILPWHLRVDILRGVTWRPIWPSWGREEWG